MAAQREWPGNPLWGYFPHGDGTWCTNPVGLPHADCAPCPPAAAAAQAAQALYLATAAGAAAWSPLLAYPFLDMPHVSMSQHGPLLMGVSDVLSRATGVAAIWAMLRNGQGATSTAGFEAAGVVSGRA